MPATTAAHPEKDQLVAFGLGKLDPAEASQIEQHLEACQDCCSTILNLQDDTFVGLVRVCQPASAAPDQSGVTLAVPAGSGAAHPAAAELPAALKAHDRYEIQELIGRGGMGDVYKAQHKVMNRVVALKVIKSHLVRNEAAVQRFRREVQAAAQLHHKHIVTAYDAEQAGELHFLVMEFVLGVNLDEVVRQRGPLPVAEACNYIRQIAEGLQHAHEQGMVHRDIKPHNLMVTKAGEVKILDFGLAGFATEVAEEEIRADNTQSGVETAAALHQLTQMGTMMGTPDYIAPEQAANAHTADIRADIYSLGCTLFTLLTGKAPFAEGSVLDKLKAHSQQEPPPISQFRADVPADVEAVLLRMLAKDPALRYQTPAEVAAAISRCGAVSPFAAVTATKSSRLWPVATALVLLIAGFAAAAIYYIQTDYGIVRVEVADDSLEVNIAGHTISTENDGQPLTIRAGQPKLLVRRGDFAFETDSFQLRRQGKEIVLKVELLPGEIVVLKDGQRFDAQPLGSTGRSQPKGLQLLAELAGHTNVVRAVRFLPGNERLVSVDGNGNVIEWDSKSKRIIRRFKIAGETYTDADISADGRLLAVGSDYGTTKGRLEIWDIAKGEALHQLTHRLNNIEQMRFSPNGDKLVAVGAPPVAVLWDVAAGTETRTIESGFAATQVKTAAFAPDGAAVALACTGRVKLFDMATGAAKHEVALPHDRVVNELTFLPGRSLLAAFQGGGWVSLVDTSSWTAGKALASASPGEVLRSGAIFNDDLLVTGSDQGVMQLLKLDGTVQATAQCGAGSCLHVSVSSDARQVVTGGGWVFDTATRKWTVTSDFKLRLWELPDSAGFQPTPLLLFNGRDMTGWKMQPDKPGNWRVENGVLIGGRLDGGSEEENSFLVTEKADFANFHLKLEAKLNPGAADAGVLFDFADGSWAEANIAFNPANRDQYVGSIMVAGTKPNERTWQAAPTDLASPDQWFTLEVIAVGRQITTKVNGKVAMVHTQRKKTTGPIRLQDHGPFTVAEFRKIEIIELDEHGKPLQQPTWTPLFNGRDLAGWRPHLNLPGNWHVENGVLIGNDARLKIDANTFLMTDRNDYKDFHLRLEARVRSASADSGVNFDHTGKWDHFTDVNITFDPAKRGRQTGSIKVYGSDEDWVITPPDMGRPNEWFTLEIIARDRHIMTKVNGRVAAESLKRKPGSQGHIMLQQRGGQTVVEFRKIEIVELDEQGKPLHQPTSPKTVPIIIGMNEEFGMLYQGQVVAPAALGRLLGEALKENPDREVAIDLPKNKWTVAGHIDQLEQIASIAGAKRITRPAWSEIRIRFGVINGSAQYLDINGPGYSASGFAKSYLPNVREVIAKNPDLPVLLDVAEGVDLADAKIAEGFEEVRRVATATGAEVRLGPKAKFQSPLSGNVPAQPSQYFQRLAGEPLESAVRERVGSGASRKITAERIPQPPGRIRYEAQIDGVGSKIIDDVFVDLRDVVMRGTDAKEVHHGEQGIALRLLRYTTPAHNGEVRVMLISRELGGQPADESKKWLLRIEASEWVKGASQATPSVVRVEGSGEQMKLTLDGAPLSREELLARLDALATGDPGFQVHVEGDVAPVSKDVTNLMKDIGATAVGEQNVKFPSEVTRRLMDDALQRGKAMAAARSKSGAGQATPGSSLTEEQIKELVSAAAGIPNEDWTKLASGTEAPSPDTLESQTLSLMLFSLRALPPAGIESELPAIANLKKDFQYLPEQTPKPAEIARALWISRTKGYASYIQPEYVTEVTVNITGDTASGEVAFEKEELYRGRVRYVARRVNGDWRIEEFHLPNVGLSLQLSEPGVWKRLVQAQSGVDSP